MRTIEPRRRYEHVVVPIDEHTLSHRAVAEGRFLADKLGAQLHLLHAEPHWDRRDDGFRRDAETVAAEVGGHAAVRARGVDDVPVSTIIDRYATEIGDAVVVMATHGRNAIGTKIFGSVTEQLVRDSSRAVVAIGPGAPSTATVLDRVVVGYDGSNFAASIVSEAAGWAKALVVPLWIVEALDPSDSQRAGSDVLESGPVHLLAEHLAGSGIDVEWETIHDRHPGKALVHFLNDKPGTMTVIATHGRTGVSRMLAGSVASEVVRHAAGPVVIQRPTQL